MRNVHSHRYYGSIDEGQVELLDRALAETVNFFAGASPSCPRRLKLSARPPRRRPRRRSRPGG